MYIGICSVAACCRPNAIPIDSAIPFIFGGAVAPIISQTKRLPLCSAQAFHATGRKNVVGDVDMPCVGGRYEHAVSVRVRLV